MPWFVYIVECVDKTYYTGISTDVLRREKEHNEDDRVGAKYTRTRRPVHVVYTEEYSTQAEALRREHRIKKNGKEYKVRLIKNRNKPPRLVAS